MALLDCGECCGEARCAEISLPASRYVLLVPSTAVMPRILPGTEVRATTLTT